MELLDTTIELARRALAIAAELALPVLAVGLVVGLVVSVMQAVTQIQDQTLTFIPKIFAMGATILILLPWLLTVMTDYAREVFGRLSTTFLP